MSKKLLVINPDNTMEVQFDQQITIGRDVFNSLCLRDAEISRSHAIIFEHDDQVVIKDLKSRNGIFVGGERVREAVLKPGDEIVLGATVLFFEPPENFDLKQNLSRRGEYLLEKNINTGNEKPAPAEVFSPEAMNTALETLFTDPDRNSFFTLDNAIMLLRAIREMDEAHDQRGLFEGALRCTLSMLGGHRGVIMEADESKKNLKVRAIVTADNSATIVIGQPVLQYVLAEEKCICCANIHRDRRFAKLGLKSGKRIHSFTAAPIQTPDELFGFIYLDAEDGSVTYSFNELRSLYFIASHLGSLLRVRPGHFARHARSEKGSDKISVAPGA
ncbi:FHA domain-containing protein [bacterium]|nr:FHA domain-containing protein [bacterium]